MSQILKRLDNACIEKKSNRKGNCILKMEYKVK